MVKFGLMLKEKQYQGNPYDSVKKVALECERLGFDSIWSADHLTQALECWTTLSALAPETQHIGLGTLVTCVSYRYPVLLAKIAATLDVISGGRVKLGIGTGWIESEYRAYGIPFPETSTKIEQLGEAIYLLKRMWTEEKVDLEGRYWSLKGAVCVPKPIHKPHPPIWIGLYGNALLKLVAETADGWNTAFRSPAEFKQKVELLKKRCSSIGRKPEEIENSLYERIIIAQNKKELEKKVKQLKPNIMQYKLLQSKYRKCFTELSMEEFMSRFIIGTPQQCVEKINEYIDAGMTYLITYFEDINDIEPLQIFAQEVMPYFQSS